MTYVAIWVMKVCGIAYNIRLPKVREPIPSMASVSSM